MFSADKWGKKTLNYLTSINGLTADDMNMIIDASQLFTGKLPTAMVNNDSDDKNDSCHQLFGQVASTCEDKEDAIDIEKAEIIGGWGLIPKSIQDVTLDNDTIELEDTPVPKAKVKPWAHPVNKSSSSAHNGRLCKV